MNEKQILVQLLNASNKLEIQLSSPSKSTIKSPSKSYVNTTAKSSSKKVEKVEKEESNKVNIVNKVCKLVENVNIPINPFINNSSNQIYILEEKIKVFDELQKTILSSTNEKELLLRYYLVS